MSQRTRSNLQIIRDQQLARTTILRGVAVGFDPYGRIKAIRDDLSPAELDELADALDDLAARIRQEIAPLH